MTVQTTAERSLDTLESAVLSLPNGKRFRVPCGHGRTFAAGRTYSEDGDVLDEWVDSIDRDGHRTRCQELPS
jgi:hypothetical protein